jgi:hypothetical protein
MKEQDYGGWFGYPQCCIDHFTSGKEITPDQYKAANYHGFVPCPEHTKQILDGEITLESLIKNRKCKTPFPGEFPKNESRYTKMFLHPLWTANWKSKAFCYRIRGARILINRINRRVKTK